MESIGGAINTGVQGRVLVVSTDIETQSVLARVHVNFMFARTRRLD